MDARPINEHDKPKLPVGTNFATMIFLPHKLRGPEIAQLTPHLEVTD